MASGTILRPSTGFANPATHPAPPLRLGPFDSDLAASPDRLRTNRGTDRFHIREEILPVPVARLCVAFLAAIVIQVYFAGLMLFGQEDGKSLHLGTGYMLAFAGMLFLALPALARAGARTVVLGVVLAVVTFFQPTITYAREESPVIAALHPVNALLIVALGAHDPPRYPAGPRGACLGQSDRSERYPDNLTAVQ